MKRNLKKKLVLNREVVRRLDEGEIIEAQGAACTNICTILAPACGHPSGFVECRPNYTCWQGCIYY